MSRVTSLNRGNNSRLKGLEYITQSEHYISGSKWDSVLYHPEYMHWSMNSCSCCTAPPGRMDAHSSEINRIGLKLHAVNAKYIKQFENLPFIFSEKQITPFPIIIRNKNHNFIIISDRI